ncbi:MAG: hypothetical protein HZY76_19620 [Anaerolineae bacterium]|nr:MAG: hypothetical protein HZY76_19620 [Anaerolineae bacterium]
MDRRLRLVSGTTYYYWLDDVNLSGTATRHGPVSALYNTPSALRLENFRATPLPSVPWAAGLSIAWPWAVVGCGVADVSR